MKKKIGVYVCECGPNIADRVDIDKIIETVAATNNTENVEIVGERHKLLCSVDGKVFLEEEIKKKNLTHLVVAACSPRDHNNTFINVCKKTELNPYLYKMINIREHCAWIIPDKDKATQKAIQYIQGGVSRVQYQTELIEKKLDTNPDVLVIGGGIAGVEAALSLARKNRKVSLIEKSGVLGGKSVGFKELLPRQSGGTEYLKKRIKEISNNENIQVFMETEIEKIIGFLGNFEITLCDVTNRDKKTEIKTGAAIVATGFGLSVPTDFSNINYDEKDEVYTSLEIEKMIAETDKIKLSSGIQPKSVGLIHCVGRDEKKYCSRICCNYMMKIANYFKNQSENIVVKEFYRDLCLPHKDDQKLFENTLNNGVDLIRIKDSSLNGTKVKYTGINGKTEETDFDMVVIAPPMEPSASTKDLAEILDIPLDEFGFFQEVHQSINPVGTSTDGIFIIGTAQGPKGISNTILTAQAASGNIRTQLIPGEQIIPEVKVSEILEAFCMGCKNCLDVCCYGSIYFDEIKGISVVNEAICRGCGNCVASCPSGAIRLKHFTNEQIYQEVIEALK
ncbi:MAG: CoB--CoM heterodisulfide reductase iron-sulfur subunit A family protein [Candidatus Marinimicrobia bacterium]|nr:CoB--CoM heterodisulfide reductase iron-sulfur subunit A family protein [Candidatus Neomarinimicrobiota bacterium]